MPILGFFTQAVLVLMGKMGRNKHNAQDFQEEQAN